VYGIRKIIKVVMGVKMKVVFTDEQIKKALEQAEANISFEEVDLKEKKNTDEKVLVKEINNGRSKRSNKLG